MENLGENTIINVVAQHGDGTPFMLVSTKISSIYKDIIENSTKSIKKYKHASTLHQLCSDPKYTVTVKSLLDTGIIDVNIVDKDGKTPLHVAVVENCNETVKLLLRNGKTNVVHQDLHGKTILHYYLMSENQPHNDIVDMIMKKCGKDKKILSLRDKDDNQPIDLACARKDGCTQQILSKLKGENENETIIDVKYPEDILNISEYDIVDTVYINESTTEFKGNCETERHFLKVMHASFKTGDLEEFNNFCNQYKYELERKLFQQKRWLHYVFELCYPNKVLYGIIKTMLRTGFESSLKDHNNMTPFQCILKKYFEAVRSQKKSHKKEKSLIMKAVMYGRICDLFLHKNNKDIGLNNKSFDNKTVLHQFLLNSDNQTDQMLQLFKKVLSRQDLMEPGLDSNQASIIHYAVANCKKKTFLKALLNKYKNLVNIPDKYGYSPLCFAAKKGVIIDVLQTLVEVPEIDVNKAFKMKTPLHFLCERDYRKHIKLLLQVPTIDTTAVDQTARTPLHIASQKSTKEVVELLLSYNKSVLNVKDQFDKTPLFYSLKNENVLAYLISQPEIGLDAVDKNGKTILHYYCSQPDCKEYIVEKMLEVHNTFDLCQIKDKEKRSASFYAHTANNLKVFDLVDTKASEILSAAAVADVDKIRSYLEKDDDALHVLDNETRYTVLHAAVRSCFGREKLASHHIESIKLVLSKGAIDINAKDFEGKTVLHFIASHEVVEGVSLHIYNLLSKAYQQNLEYNVKCSFGKTPLLYCIESNKAHLLKELLKSTNLNLDCVDEDGKNLFHYIAAYSKSNEMFNFVYNKFIDINENATNTSIQLSPLKRDREKKIPLFYAAENYYGDKFVWDFLNSFRLDGRSINMTNNKHGKTALLHAIERKNIKVVQTILDYLRENEFSLDATDRMGRNVLHYCLEHGTKDILKIISEVLIMSFCRGKCWLLSKDHSEKTPLDRLAAEHGHLLFDLGDLVDMKMVVDELDYDEIKALGDVLNHNEKWKLLCENLNELPELERYQFDICSIEFPKFTEVGEILLRHIEERIITIAELKLVGEKCKRTDLVSCLLKYRDEMKLADLKLRERKKISYFLGRNDHLVDVKEILSHFGLLRSFCDLERIYKHKNDGPAELIVRHLKEVAGDLPLEKFHGCFKGVCCNSILVDCLKKRLKYELGRSRLP